ncbi:hypothetical protein PRIPAC_95413 [Pristionchus pacificus]|uniref:G protein-coupled receptor n=1 Tax=Pristionchus pacificus TaxID=54126 RepID=A0A2A6BIQ1_PRIPA|nr:hypothetical protein PRIPAC_95413 [Pristionchus pacificus]|eukprot:PDM65769.1 G protein-coupled receptor [Pristionchus pacificus]
MPVPSDISRYFQYSFVYSFYVIGSISLVVNSATLFIILTKSSALTREVKLLTVFQQLSCLLSNAFFTLFFIPFFYLQMGGGYCMGILCFVVPYQHLLAVQVFLIMCMLSSFGMMLVARQQMIIWDTSIFKLITPVKYVIYAIIIGVTHQWTAVAIVLLSSNRAKQNSELDATIYYWTIYRSTEPLFKFPCSLCCLCSLSCKCSTSFYGKTDFNAMSVFEEIMSFPAAVVIAEGVFGCSTLVNSIVIVTRNRAYLAALSSNFRRKPPTTQQPCIVPRISSAVE